jgi:hypothetical protein
MNEWIKRTIYFVYKQEFVATGYDDLLRGQEHIFD